jgi:antitoxin component HigA of HigAB toxin-antitoxin module
MNEVNATPHAELIFELMNPNNSKNEREHAAVREIEQLRETRQAIIAGVLFDFMGWLTSRKERLVLSGADEAGPAVDVIRDFAKMRGLSLDDAKVQDWQDMARGSNAP